MPAQTHSRGDKLLRWDGQFRPRASIARTRWSPLKRCRPRGMPMTPASGSAMRVRCASELVANVLQLVNAVRREIREPVLAALPRGAIPTANAECPVARALGALVLPDERRVVFCYPWYASAATKVWGVSFADPLLTSVTMPDTIFDFTIAFRLGHFPDLLE